MDHHLIIDHRRCRGVALCHCCEAITPGIVAACRSRGHVVVAPWAVREMSPMISQLIVACPDRAIMVRPA